MSEDVTILTSANHTSLVKTFSGPDLTEQPFAIGKDFNVTEEPVSNLQSLSKILQRLEYDPTQTSLHYFVKVRSLMIGKAAPRSISIEGIKGTPPEVWMSDNEALWWWYCYREMDRAIP